jgi:hypothetical protein
LNVKKIAYMGVTGYISAICSLGYWFKKTTLPELNLEASVPIPEQVIYQICQDRHISRILSKSSRKYVLTAIAKVESSFVPQVRGDNGASVGMFQYQPKHWGRAGDSLEDQTKKAEQILLQLEKMYGRDKAVERYNGRGKTARAYRAKVLHLVKEMEKEERRLNGKG